MRNFHLLVLAAWLTGCAGIQSGHYIRVQRGESLKRLSGQYHVPIQQLKDFNPGSSFHPGQVIFIPLKGGILSPQSVIGRSPTSLSYTRGKLLWPVPASKAISSHFGRRWGRNHNGVDIQAAEGSAILAVAPGKVIYSGKKLRGFGNMIVIRHARGLYTLYAHNQMNYARVGQQVARGQLIGRVGHTGRSTGDHLHFEVRQGDKALNPLAFYSRGKSPSLAQHRH